VFEKLLKSLVPFDNLDFECDYVHTFAKLYKFCNESIEIQEREIQDNERQERDKIIDRIEKENKDLKSELDQLKSKIEHLENEKSQILFRQNSLINEYKLLLQGKL